MATARPIEAGSLTTPALQFPVSHGQPLGGIETPRVQSEKETAELESAGYIRSVKNGSWLTLHMAAEFGLWLDRRTNTYVFLGRPGDPVRLVVQDMFEPNEEWRAVSTAERVNFTSARQLLRQAIAPYSLSPRPDSRVDRRT